MAEPESAAEVAAFEAWLAADPRHARAYDQFDRLGALTQETAGPRGEARPRAAPRSRLRPATGIAAALAVTLASVVWLADGSPNARAAVNNSGPAVRGIRLRSGAVIILDRRTKLLVSTAPATNEVTVEAGRARFAVRDSGSAPLTVVSAGVAIVAETATFDVERSGDDVTVAVIDGKVVARDTDRPGDATAVMTGEMAGTHSGGLQKISQPTADPRWPDRRVQFDDVPLRDVVAVANRRNTRAIIFAAPVLGNLRVSGTLNLTDPRALARKLSSAFDLRVVETPSGILLRR